MSKVETFFLITVNEDGTLTTYPEIPEKMPEAARKANNWDVYSSARQIVEEFDQTTLANKVASTVLAALTPQTPQGIPDVLKDKLKERGINPESALIPE